MINSIINRISNNIIKNKISNSPFKRAMAIKLYNEEKRILIKWINKKSCLVSDSYGQSIRYKPVYAIENAIIWYCTDLLTDPIKWKNKNYSEYDIYRSNAELRLSYPKFTTDVIHKIKDIITNIIPNLLKISIDKKVLNKEILTDYSFLILLNNNWKSNSKCSICTNTIEFQYRNIDIIIFRPCSHYACTICINNYIKLNGTKEFKCRTCKVLVKYIFNTKKVIFDETLFDTLELSQNIIKHLNKYYNKKLSWNL